MPSFPAFWRSGFVIALCFCTGLRTIAVDTIIPVATSAELHQALANAQPGQTIVLTDGVYQGEFTAITRGTAVAPITLQGSHAAILQGPALTGGYVFHLDGADYWVLSGFTLRSAAKGIMLDNANNNVLDHLLIQQIGQEAVHFRTCSSYNTIQESTIQETGLITPGFGEGVYVGSAADNWTDYSCDAERRDKSHYNQILNNDFGPNIRAEAIDVKEGTTGGIILGNVFDATGLQGKHFADSWIDIKGNRYKIGYNRGVQGNNPALQHGFETHSKVEGWGRNNIFYANVLTMNSNGYGIHIDNTNEAPDNTVCANNEVTGAGLGDANIPLTGKPAHQVAGASSERYFSVTQTLSLADDETIWLPLITKGPCD